MKLTDLTQIDEEHLLLLYHNAAVSAANSFKNKWKQIYGEELAPENKLDSFIETADLEKDWRRFEWNDMCSSLTIPESVSNNARSYEELIEFYSKLKQKKGSLYSDEDEIKLFISDLLARKEEILLKTPELEERTKKFFSDKELLREYLRWKRNPDSLPATEIGSEKQKEFTKMIPLSAHFDLDCILRNHDYREYNANELRKTCADFRKHLNGIKDYFNKFYLVIDLIADKQSDGKYCVFLENIPQYGASFLKYILTGELPLRLEKEITRTTEVIFGLKAFHATEKVPFILSYHTLGKWDYPIHLNSEGGLLSDLPNSISEKEVVELKTSLEKTMRIKVNHA